MHLVRQCDWELWVQKAACVGSNTIPRSKEGNLYEYAIELADVQAFDRPVRYLDGPNGEATVWRSAKRQHPYPLGLNGEP